MDRVFNEQRKKDKFMTEHLLPELVSRIENSENPDQYAKKVAQLEIFPYIAEGNAVRISSLRDGKVSWYFQEKPEDGLVSSDTYRIFAEKLFKQDALKKIRKVLQERKLVSEFTNEVVIENTVNKMGEQTDYTTFWWQCALEVFKLVDENSRDSSLSRATRNIHNNKFLFLDNYFDQKLKAGLIEYGVFSDVIDETAKKVFFERIPETSHDAALSFLKRLGIPCSFKNELEDNTMNQYILNFLSKQRSLSYPVKSSSQDSWRKCEFTHELFFGKIIKDSFGTFSNTVNNQNYAGGIPVLNVNGDYCWLC